MRTFSEESLLSGGLFSFQPEIKTGTADANTRYSNTLANLAISAATPALAAVDPSAVPQGTTLDVELTGSNTGFRSGSTVAVAGSGVSVASADVLSPTRIVARLTAAPGAAAGFRDVTVSTDRGDGSIETAKGIGAVQVVGAPTTPTVLSVTPSTVAAGATRDVTISGGLTHFAPGVERRELRRRGDRERRLGLLADVGGGQRHRRSGRDGRLPRRHGDDRRRGRARDGDRPAPGHRRDAVDPAADERDAELGRARRDGRRGAARREHRLRERHVAGLRERSRGAGALDDGDQPYGGRRAAEDRRRRAARLPRREGHDGAQSAALLDGFEVTAIAGAATGGPPAQGGAGAGASSSGRRPSTCSDHSRPTASFLAGKQGVRAQQGRLRLRGRAADKGCVAAISVAGAVARVEVAISRAAGRRCRFVAASGKLSTARSCSKPVWLKAKGTTSWSLTTKRRLPRGTYTIQLRSRDAAGNLQASVASRTLRLR